MSFQKTVGFKQAVAVEGDFASTNTTIFTVADEQQLLAEPAGVTVGHFAWMDYATGLVSNLHAAGKQLLFVHRENNAQIQSGSEASLLIQGGFPVAGFSGGDFWVRVSETVTAGTPVFADVATGAAKTSGEATNFIFRTSAAVGELAKISSWGV